MTLRREQAQQLKSSLPKSFQIKKGVSDAVSAVKLKRTDTTHDLSQKAKRLYGKLQSAVAAFIPHNMGKGLILSGLRIFAV